MWNTHWRWSNWIFTKRKWIRDAKFGRKQQVWNSKWSWRSRSINPKINRDHSNADTSIFVQIWKAWLQSVLTYRADKITSSKWGIFILNSIWPWRSRFMIPRNNRDFNHGNLHFWLKFGVIAQTSVWLTDTHTHIKIHRDRRRRRQ